MPTDPMRHKAPPPHLHGLRISLFGTLLVAALSSITISARADCQPDAAAAGEAAYTGYTPTGYKGAAERDPVWHRNVRSRTAPDGQQEYRLRHQPIWYDSIEPISLGSNAPGYHVRRGGCGHLLDKHGKPLPLPAFTRLEIPYEAHTGRGALYKLFEQDADGERYRYVRFVDGQLRALSPHAYLMNYGSSSLEQVFLREGLTGIVTGSPERHGVLNLSTLEEIVPPEWRGVTGLGLLPYDNERRYLLTDDGQTRTLLSADGKYRLLTGIDKIKLIPDWFPQHDSTNQAERAIIAVTENGGQTCRLFDLRLNLLLPVTLKTQQGECPTWRGGQPAKYYVAESFDNLIHVFTLEAPARLQTRSRIPGQLATATDKGMVLAFVDTPQGKRYRAFTPEGQRANEQDFDEFRHLGCGFLEVRIGTKWLTLYHDGSTTEKRFWPFSC